MHNSSTVILLKFFILSIVLSEDTNTLDNAVFIMPFGVSDDVLIEDIIVFFDDSNISSDIFFNSEYRLPSISIFLFIHFSLCELFFESGL